MKNRTLLAMRCLSHPENLIPNYEHKTLHYKLNNNKRIIPDIISPPDEKDTRYAYEKNSMKHDRYITHEIKKKNALIL
jgi:hypothetical protein